MYNSKEYSLLNRIWDIISDICWYRPIRYLTDVKYYVKNKWFLIVNGWRRSDAWDLGVWFSDIAPKILRHSAKTTVGYPDDVTLKLAKSLFPEIFPSDEHTLTDEAGFADWKLILNTLADLIENSNVNTCTYKNLVEVVGPISSSKKVKRISSKTGKDVTYYTYEILKNDTFDAWCAREDEIQRLCDDNRVRSLKIFSELLPSLWF